MPTGHAFSPDDIEVERRSRQDIKFNRCPDFSAAHSTVSVQVDFLKPLSAGEERTSLEFFDVLDFVLQFCPTHSSEIALMARFAKIGVGAGKTFDAKSLTLTCGKRWKVA